MAGILVTRIAQRLRQLSRQALLYRATDVTQAVAPRSALVVAPHPDDETLGCGARIALARRAGTQVTVVAVTDGSASHEAIGIAHAEIAAVRRAELMLAVQRLGVGREDLITLSCPDNAVVQHIETVSAEIERIVADRKPADVYVTSGRENHPDHAATFRAVRHAIEQCRQPVRLLEYPIWLWSDWPVSRRFAQGRGIAELVGTLLNGRVERVDVDDVFDAKRHALSAYRSQLGEGRYGMTTTTLPSVVIDRALNAPELYFEVKAQLPRG